MKKLNPVATLILVVVMIVLGKCANSLKAEQPKTFYPETPTHYYDTITWELLPIKAEINEVSE